MTDHNEIKHNEPSKQIFSTTKVPKRIIPENKENVDPLDYQRKIPSVDKTPQKSIGYNKFINFIRIEIDNTKYNIISPLFKEARKRNIISSVGGINHNNEEKSKIYF